MLRVTARTDLKTNGLEKKWNIHQAKQAEDISSLQASLAVDETIAKLLSLRGIKSFDDAKTFFRPSLDMLHDPFLMKGMGAAIERIIKAIANHEKVMIFGDYDVDGTTSVALVYSFFRKYIPEIRYYIPDRYAEGYGISFKSIDYAEENNYSLIIALDCGIKANDKIDYANSKNIDFIICDHHLPGDEIPKAVAVLDPKQDDCPYPYKELAGCGIGFKLAQAFCIQNGMDEQEVFDYLDLVVTSIAADIVPITGENRVLAHFGLKQLNADPRPGLKALLALNKQEKELDINTLVFTIAPRINAAGRIEHGSKAVELLISNTDEATEFSKKINETNLTRRDIDISITDEAFETLDRDPITPFKKSTVLFNPSWHKGVVGIVASRMIERYYKPTIILTESNGMATGSARSVKDFDVYTAIENCSHLLEQFGGHKFAAGLSLKTGNIKAFIEAFEHEVSRTIKPEMLIPTVEIDLEILLDDINDKLIRILNQFAPHGPHNMTPVFCSRGVLDTGFARLVGNNHLKLEVYQPNTKLTKLEAIGFNKGDYLNFFKRNIPVDIVYKIKVNEFRGATSIQLLIDEIKAS
ncbi:MAG: single-stranded-DNA-specific exonuclease RecJ [Bacteroidetes bacterium]|jgi:single-stranded-DNA-specific exonuclease|nr:single-stranded-DNA-specific exonuclease RecJ [Bacteroidota bacterium]